MPPSLSAEESSYATFVARLKSEGCPGQRVANVFYNLGYGSKAEVREAIAQGILKPKGHGSPRNYGFKSHRRVCEWVGLPYDPKSIRVLRCPHCSKIVQFYTKP